MSDIRGELLDIYNQRAIGRYGLSAVSQQQHALQSAALAETQGEPAALIVVALLHDIGHMVHDLGEEAAKSGIDDLHEELGAQWLATRFGRHVTEPVRLHVPAKRYLCAVDMSYFGKLSPDSVRSLALQGGPMSREEVQSFERLDAHGVLVVLGPHQVAGDVLDGCDVGGRVVPADAALVVAKSHIDHPVVYTNATPP